MDARAKADIFRDVFKILARPTASSCLCRQIYAFELYKYMKEKHKIHPVVLDIHDEMVRLGIANELKFYYAEQNKNEDEGVLYCQELDEEASRLIKEAVEVIEKEELNKDKIDTTRWAEELAQDICT